MSYYFSKIINKTFDEAIALVTEELKKRGFGIITEIDVRETFKNKLNVDFRNYKILGACNPSFAYKALTAEDKIGTMLPCNVIVQQLDSDKVEVATIDPLASMMAVKNVDLESVSVEVRKLLRGTIESL